MKVEQDSAIKEERDAAMQDQENRPSPPAPLPANKVSCLSELRRGFNKIKKELEEFDDALLYAADTERDRFQLIENSCVVILKEAQRMRAISMRGQALALAEEVAEDSDMEGV